jgi:hypothetical protein
MLASPVWDLPLGVPSLSLIYFSRCLHACNMSEQFHIPLFAHYNNIK